jgi:pimeloyl-ACP methyl ester carboxylesterase
MNKRSILSVATATFLSAGLSLNAAAAATTAASAASVTDSFHRPIHTSLTVILVHGAFADSSSWNVEISLLRNAGYPVIAYANPLRGIANDAVGLDALVKSVDGPVVLVGHSYAGMVVSQVAAQEPTVKAIVYVAALIPVVGESTNDLVGKFPGSELTSDNLHTSAAANGQTDVYINQDKYGTVYAGGLSQADISVAAAGERPIAAEAFTEKATLAAPAFIPKWEIVATQDHAVPTQVQEFMANRAGARIVRTESGHDVPAAQPFVVARVIAAAIAAAGR